MTFATASGQVALSVASTATFLSPNGYFTTTDASVHAVWSLTEDLGFNIEVQYQKPVAR